MSKRSRGRVPIRRLATAVSVTSPCNGALHNSFKTREEL
jgi:hypothetical protein